MKSKLNLRGSDAQPLVDTQPYLCQQQELLLCIVGDNLICQPKIYSRDKGKSVVIARGLGDDIC
jgi:hypothetical protein